MSVPANQHGAIISGVSTLRPRPAPKLDIVDGVYYHLLAARHYSQFDWLTRGRDLAARIVTEVREGASDVDLVAAMRAELVEQEERHDTQLGAIRALVERLQTERLTSTREGTCAEIFGLLE